MFNSFLNGKQIQQSKDTELPVKPTDDAIEAIIHHATSSRPSPDPRSLPPKDTRTQLFVGNLPYRVRWQDLKDLFRKAGTVLRADVSLGPDNRSRGYGTVLLATAEDAGRAVDMFNGYSWQTRILEVRLDRLMPEYDPVYLATMASVGLSANPPAPQPASILGTTDLSNSQLSHMNIHSPAVSNTSAALHQDDSLSSSYLPDGSSSRSLFVGNLPFHCQWQDLKDLFRQAGTILRADVALGADGRSRGFGTVSFATEHDADRAMRMFNGYEYGGRQLKVHHDKFLQTGMLNHPSLALPSSLPGSTTLLPSLKPPSAMSSQSQMHVPLPAGYRYDFLPPSGSTSPYDMQHLRLHSAQHNPAFPAPSRSTVPQQSALQPLLAQQLQQSRSPKLSHFQIQSPLHTRDQSSHSLLQPQPQPHHQHFSRIFGTGSSAPASSTTSSHKPSPSLRKDADIDNLAQVLGATRLLSSPSSKQPSRSMLNQTYSESRLESARQSTSSSALSASTSVSGISPAISNAPSTSTASSSTSISSTPSTAPKAMSESAPSSGSSPAISSTSVPIRSTERPQMQERKSAHQAHGPQHAPNYPRQQFPYQQHQNPSQSYQHAAARQNHHPGPISLPPVPHVAFPGSPHTPLGHGMSLSPLYHPSMGSPYHLHPSSYHPAYQQHYQHTPLGLPTTPSMPPFTFLAPNTAVNGPNSGLGSDAKAREDSSRPGSHSTSDSVDPQQSKNAQASSANPTGAEGVSGQVSSGVPIHTNPPHMHHHYAHAHAAAAAAHAHAQHMSQPSPLHMRLNLANVPGSFSPGVAMSPGTFFGRPGEMAAVANPFINPAVGAPVHHVPMSAVGMNMNMMGVPLMAMGRVNMNMNMNVNMSVSSEGPDTAVAQGQGQGQDGQAGDMMAGTVNVPMGVPHGAYFYAMASPKRTGTGTEPQGYFDPMYFPLSLQQQPQQQQQNEDRKEESSQASGSEDAAARQPEEGHEKDTGESDAHEPPTQDSESGNPWYARYRDNDAAGIVVSSSTGSTISRTHSVGAASRTRAPSSSLDDALGVGSISSTSKTGEWRSSLSPELPKMQTPLMKRSGSESAHTNAMGKPRLPIHARRGISKEGGSISTGAASGSVAFQLSHLQPQTMQQSSSALTSSTPPPVPS
ncbi:hypothetical protein CVT24_001443 [Panaeolus cyanescens]|uniref:RRM domain-containing protein n=1 Tax=Panaeolus cyanescens TaxID=181874 RepID=A0A409YU36_9AGAR|nr:hypothetical protein CVT24_001443 [Panaeolus cyanescens]